MVTEDKAEFYPVNNLLEKPNDPAQTQPRMKTNEDFIINIPRGIASRPGLSLTEQILLAKLLELPAISNAALARLLRCSVSGVETALRRLRQQGHIEAVGNGRARWHRLMFPVEHQKKSGQSHALNTHSNNGVHAPASRSPAKIDPIALVHRYQWLIELGAFLSALDCMTELKQWAKSTDTLNEADRSNLVAKTEAEEHRTLAYSLAREAARPLKRQSQEELFMRIATAKPDQLRRFADAYSKQQCLTAVQVFALPCSTEVLDI